MWTDPWKTIAVGSLTRTALLARRTTRLIFSRYHWGGCPIWRLWPENQVFIDGRTDLYWDEVLRNYSEIMMAVPRAMDLLERCEVT